MKTFLLHETGPAENLTLTETAVPQIADGEVLVQVKAISINPVDVKTRDGKGLFGRMKEYMPLTLGWDISGTVTESRSDAFKPGDAVFGMVNFPGHGKAYAEYVAAPAHQLALKPENISHEEAAAATLTALTAWQALVKHPQIKAGDRVLIHAAAGGVGHFAVQIARHIGAHVIGTSSAANRETVLGLGANEHIDYTVQPFETVVNDVDFVLDTIGGENLERSLEVIRPGGALISIPSGISEDLGEKAKNKEIAAAFILVESNGADMRTLAGLLEKGILKAHVSQTFPFVEMAEAHRQLETGRTVGKIVVTL